MDTGSHMAKNCVHVKHFFFGAPILMLDTAFYYALGPHFLLGHNLSFTYDILGFPVFVRNAL